MKQPTPDEHGRMPGRSFEDPRKPMGEEILAHSGPSKQPEEDFRGRDHQAAASQHGVAERAKTISVLRKVEELISEDDPPANDEAGLRTALELAAGRVGLTIEEYHSLVKGDPEVEDLERKVLDAARAKFDR